MHTYQAQDNLTRTLGIFGKAVDSETSDDFDKLRGNCDKFEVTCKLVSLFRGNNMTKTDLRKVVQITVRQLKPPQTVTVLDGRLQDRVKAAMQLK